MLTPVRMACRALFSRRAVESEMDREMRLHVDLETEENIRRGLAPGEARRQAMLSFGGMDSYREATRDERGTRWIEHTLSDARFAVRSMRKQPLYAATIILLIALGTGSNAAIFSALNQLVLNPLPFEHADRMVMLTGTAGGGRVLVTPPRALSESWIARSALVERFGLSTGSQRALLGDTAAGGESVWESPIDPGMMRLVGMRPFLGRGIQDGDTVAGAPAVAMLSQGLWERRFGGDPRIIGTTIRLDGQPTTIVGIAPRGFFVPFSRRADLFSALQSGARRDPIALLKPGVTRTQATAEVTNLARQLDTSSADNPPMLRGQEAVTPRGTTRILLLLTGAVAFVLLIACANVANLHLVRAWSRRHEFAVRSALGASRGRLVGQVLVESLLYAVIGGAVGVATGFGFLRLLIVSGLVAGIDAVSIDRVTMLWTSGVTMLTGAIVGTAPAWLVGASRFGELLKASARGISDSTVARRTRAALVVVEVALSLTLVVATGLVLRSVTAMARADVGVAARGLSTVQMQLTGPAFRDSINRRDALKNVVAAVREVPGVSAVSYGMEGPTEFLLGMGGFDIDGASPSALDSLRTVRLNVTAPDFFAVAGTRVLQGRVFAADSRPRSRPGSGEVVINESFAKRFWPGGAVGQRVRYSEESGTIVGVVEDVAVPGEGGVGAPQLYLASPGAPIVMTLVIRSSLPPAQLEPLVSGAIRRGSGLVKTQRMTSVDDRLAEVRRRPTTIRNVLAVFAILALLLAAVGLHAAVAYTVRQREREIGIRLALGANPQSAAGLVLREGLGVAVAGIAVGLLTTTAIASALTGLLYGIGPRDLPTTVAAATILLSAAAVACIMPARRAARIDPVVLLRAE